MLSSWIQSIRGDIKGTQTSALVRYWPLWIGLVMLLGIALSVATGRRPDYAFKEGRPFTLLSCAQLVAIGLLVLHVFRIRGGQFSQVLKRQHRATAIWFLMGAGCIFLAFDEVACIHEMVGDWLQDISDQEKTLLGESMDGMVVFLYGVLALGIFAMIPFRVEIKLMRHGLAWIILAFVLFGAMSVGDILSETEQIFRRFLDDDKASHLAYMITATIEDYCKLLAEAFMLLAMHKVRRIAMEMAQAESLDSHDSDTNHATAA